MGFFFRVVWFCRWGSSVNGVMGFLGRIKGDEGVWDGRGLVGEGIRCNGRFRGCSFRFTEVMFRGF